LNIVTQNCPTWVIHLLVDDRSSVSFKGTPGFHFKTLN
jgi:hypothetical protein